MSRPFRSAPMSAVPTLRAVVVCLSLLVSAALIAHEGHDHDAEAGAAVPAAATMPDGGVPGRTVVELTSELYEAVVESHGDHIDIWLDRYDSNEPVTGARVGVTLGDAAEVVAAEESPGQYMASIKPLAPGAAAALTLSIKAPAGEDLLGGTLADATPPPEPLTARLVSLLAEGWRWLLAALVAVGAAVVLLRRRMRGRGRLLASFVVVTMCGATIAAWPVPASAHEGHDHADEQPAAPLPAAATGGRPARLADGSVFVPKPTQRLLELRTVRVEESDAPRSLRLAGELVGDPRASAVVQTLQGGRVAGEGGSWPVLGARVRRGQVLLRLTPSGSGSERASSAAEAARVDAELTQARADLARLEGLAGVVSRAEVETQRSRVASLVAQRTALRTSLSTGGERLVAPIDGVIASIDARPGMVVSPGETLLTVIDPARMSVEALAFEPVAAGGILRASVALRDGPALEARLAGVGAQTRGGAVPVRLDIVSVAPGLVAGQPVTVFLERASSARGLLLPSTAVIRAPNGERIVFEKVAAERFVPRAVRIEQVSADRVVVLAGIAPQARIVVRGAHLVGQIR
ncbi:MAG: efflux RND transporter periplasmic adaptor subunit [Gammaproteobacteria bacterium]|jgi:cobalt-zinc-cadmium efflux system membrane fusion protein